MLTTLLLVRHGETDDNRRLIFQGQGGRGLNALGERQAARLAERLDRHGGLERPDAVVSSDLERAVETAAILAAPFGLTPTLDPDLREVDVGAWTGKSYDEIERAYPEQWGAWVAGLDVRRGGGETYAELALRVDEALRRAAHAHAGKRVLVVSHGGAIKAFVSRLLGLGPPGGVLGSVLNTSVTRLATDTSGSPRRTKLLGFNDASHLEGL